MRRYDLQDDQWEKIKDLLLGRITSVGIRASDNRLFIEAILDHYRAGIPWRDLGSGYVVEKEVRALKKKLHMVAQERDI